MASIVRYTPNLQALRKKIGFDDDQIHVEKSTLQTSKEDVVLFTGSILDKSEIDYRQLTKTEGKYFTILPNDLKDSEVDIYWKLHTMLLTQSEAEYFLSDKKIHRFLQGLDVVQSWYKESMDEYNNSQYTPSFETDLSELVPLNNETYTDMLQVSGFRSSSATEYMDIKYNPHDKKGTKALIVRFSLEADDSPIDVINVTGLEDQEELSRFFLDYKLEIRSFCRAEEKREEDVDFEGKSVVMEKITAKIPEELMLIVAYKDKSAKAIFSESDLDNLDEIEDFVLLRTYSNEKCHENLDHYKEFFSFFKSSKSAEEQEAFLSRFFKIIQRSNNLFLSNMLFYGDDKQKKKIMQEALMNFYLYLEESYAKYANNSDDPNERQAPTQLAVLIAVLKSVDSIDELDERFVCHIYFYIRKSVLQGNTDFLSRFEAYKKQSAVDENLLNEIESCLKESGAIEEIDDEVFASTLTLEDPYRRFDDRYLNNLMEYMELYGCTEHLKKVQSILEKQVQLNTYDYDEERDENDTNEVIDRLQLHHKFATPEQIVVDTTFGNTLATMLTFIDRILCAPLLLKSKEAKYVDVKRMQDLTIMWSVFDRTNRESTLGNTKRFIQRCYLGIRPDDVSANEWKAHKEQWTSAVAGLIHKLYADHYTLDTHSGLIIGLNIDRCEFELDIEMGMMDKSDDLQAVKEYESEHTPFMKQSGYVYPDRFITLKAAANKFDKYYEKVNNEGEKTRYIISLLAPAMTQEFVDVLSKESSLAKSNQVSSVSEGVIAQVKRIVCKEKYMESGVVDELCKEVII